jgi:hypothetical protein
MFDSVGHLASKVGLVSRCFRGKISGPEAPTSKKWATLLLQRK